MSQFLPRYLSDHIAADLKDRMVFIGGPRQVGKTTFSLSFLDEASVKHPAYLSWDSTEIRSKLLRGELPAGESTIILDEIHKFARWRNLVKGFFDTLKDDVSFIVTGSARLDFYRKGGDSLHGRYFYYRLHPFSLSEIDATASDSSLSQLLEFGGFPEPLLKADKRFSRRWQRQRKEKIVYDDVRDLENVKEISLIELLAEELPNRVGSPLSVKNLATLLGVSHATADRWIEVMERMYYCFRIPPFSGKRIRAVKKEQKLYMWDWSEVEDSGARFENLMACQLLKYCHYLEDTEGFEMDLRYLRDTDKREVDFVVIKNKKPLFAVECKTGEKKISPTIPYFKERTSIPAFYQVHLGHADHIKNSVRVLPFKKFCIELGMP